MPKLPWKPWMRPMESRRSIAHGEGARARSPATVGCGEGLVQIQVHDVEAHVARPNDADDRVEVGPVVVKKPADLVYRRGYPYDVALEEAEGVGIREHETCDVLVEHVDQGLDVHEAALVGTNIDGLVAGKRNAGGIGSVSGVGDDDPPPRITVRLVPCPHDQESRQLALRSGGGLHRYRIHA